MGYPGVIGCLYITDGSSGSYWLFIHSRWVIRELLVIYTYQIGQGSVYVYVCVLAFPATSNGQYNTRSQYSLCHNNNHLARCLIYCSGVCESSNHQPRLQSSHDTLHTIILIRFNKQACEGIHNTQVEIWSLLNLVMSIPLEPYDTSSCYEFC